MINKLIGISTLFAAGVILAGAAPTLGAKDLSVSASLQEAGRCGRRCGHGGGRCARRCGGGGYPRCGHGGGWPRCGHGGGHGGGRCGHRLAAPETN